MPNPKKAVAVKRIKVRATRTGYYDNERKREGAVFVYELSEDEEKKTREKRRRENEDENDGLPSWVARVDPSTPLKNSTGQQEINQQVQATRDERMAGKTGDQEVL